MADDKDIGDELYPESDDDLYSVAGTDESQSTFPRSHSVSSKSPTLTSEGFDDDIVTQFPSNQFDKQMRASNTAYQTRQKQRQVRKVERGWDSREITEIGSPTSDSNSLNTDSNQPHMLYGNSRGRGKGRGSGRSRGVGRGNRRGNYRKDVGNELYSKSGDLRSVSVIGNESQSTFPRHSRDSEEFEDDIVPYFPSKEGDKPMVASNTPDQIFQKQRQVNKVEMDWDRREITEIGSLTSDSNLQKSSPKQQHTQHGNTQGRRGRGRRGGGRGRYNRRRNARANKQDAETGHAGIQCHRGIQQLHTNTERHQGMNQNYDNCSMGNRRTFCGRGSKRGGGYSQRHEDHPNEIDPLNRKPTENIHDQIQQLCQDDDASATVQVSDIKHTTSEETVAMYFESSRRSGGGPISVIDLNRGTAIITFEDPAVAAVVASRCHKLGGSDLLVMPVRTKKDSCPRNQVNSQVEQQPLQEGDASATVEVSNIHQGTSEETVSLYFENTRRSGGGPISDIKLDQGTARITFEDPSVAVAVANRSHKLGGSDLIVVPVKTRKACPERSVNLHRILLTGIPDGTNEENLMLYIESRTKIDEEPEMLYGEIPGTALVQYTNEIEDIDQIIDNFKKKKLQQKEVRASLVEHPDCILVQNLTPTISEDTIELYFESERKSGGGVVREVQMIQTRNQSIVFFEDWRVVDRVTSRQHTLSQISLNVSVYFEQLGKIVSSDGPTQHIPDPVSLQIDPEIAEFMLGNNGQNRLRVDRKILSENGRIVWPSQGRINTVEIVPVESTSYHSTWTQWPSRVASRFAEICNEFKSDHITVEEDIWTDVCSFLQEVNPDNVRTSHKADQATVFLCGPSAEVESVMTRLNNAVRDLKAAAEIAKQVIKKPVKLADDKVQFLLQCPGFLCNIKEELETKWRVDIRLTPETNTQEINLEGIRSEVEKAQSDLHTCLNNLVKFVFECSPNKVRFLRQVQDKVHEILTTRGIHAAASIDGNKVTIIGASDQDTQSAYKFIQNDITEVSILIPNQLSTSILETHDGKALFEEVNRNKVAFAAVDASKRCINIAGFRDDVKQALDKVQKYIRKNVILEQSLKVPSVKKVSLPQKFPLVKPAMPELKREPKDFGSFRSKSQNAQGEFGSIDGVRAADFSKPSFPEACQSDDVGSTVNATAAFSSILNYPVTAASSDDVCFPVRPTASNISIPSSGPYVSAVDGVTAPGLSIPKYQAAAAPPPPPPTQPLAPPAPAPPPPAAAKSSVVGSSVDATAGGYSIPLRYPTAANQSSSLITVLSRDIVTTKENKAITLKRGDIAAEIVDIIVNTTGSSMNINSGGVSNAISNAAGPGLQQNCTRILNQTGNHNVAAGDFIETGPANLQCQYVFHSVCESYRGPSSQTLLRSLMQKILQQANQKGSQSIAIPAIGTGSLGFPANVTAQIMYDEVITFSQQNPVGSLFDIRFVVHHGDQATIQAFEDETLIIYQEIQQTPVRTSRSFQPFAPMLPISRLQNRGLFRQSPPRTVDSVNRLPQSLKTSRYQQAKTKQLMRSYNSIQPASSTGNNFGTVTLSADGSYNMQIGHMTVQLHQGDLTRENTDAIVNSAGSDLRLCGPLSQTILRSGGNEIARECQQLARQGHTEAVMTTAGRLSCRNIIHVVTPHNGTQLKSVVLKALYVADSSGLSSIAFPALGTGKIDVATAAKILLDAIREFAVNASQRSLLHVTIAIFQAGMLQTYAGAMKGQRTINPSRNHGNGIPTSGQRVAKTGSNKIRRTDQNAPSNSFPLNGQNAPSNWIAMNGQNFVKIQLMQGSQEFTQVQTTFQKSLGRVPRIHQVERIQVLDLYKSYMAKMERIKSVLPAGMQAERTLFHGTSADTCDKINRHGFNRSYSGKNGTAYGKGTYFARDASYSDKYAVPSGPNNHKCMYMCKVLTGEHARGNPNMVSPPPKPNSATEMCDSVVDNPGNPKVFVVFHDSQAYPEYLIAYT